MIGILTPVFPRIVVGNPFESNGDDEQAVTGAKITPAVTALVVLIKLRRVKSFAFIIQSLIIVKYL
jgi:hypothetical protein